MTINHEKNRFQKWTTQVVPIDIDTGEVIDEYQIASGAYIIIKKTSYCHERSEQHAIRIVEWHARRNPQQCFDF